MQNNTPPLWQKYLPRKTVDSHKYTHGHGLIYGAPELTGATRLAAVSCARMGAGLVTVLANKDVSSIYRISLPPHIMVRDTIDWNAPHVTARLYGPGGLIHPPDFNLDMPVVLDADALLSLPTKLSPNYILTPHAGEFTRAFPNLAGTRPQQAVVAAKRINAHLVLKGAQTIIAAPDGTCVVNDHASPYLATAGTGDTLAGMITGLVTQHMPLFAACCAAVWIHGEAALQLGAGLVSSDLQDRIAPILKTLYPV